MARCLLIQAAQQYSRQQGPLGHFFRRLKTRKCHNIAVVATARKLAMIAWRMLTSNEPYRYSEPRTTTDKLAALRVAVTGEKRRGGNPRGQKCEARLPGGSRSIRSLDQACQNEDLPARSPLPPGELRHLNDSGSREFADRISAPQVIPRRSPKNTPQTTKPSGRQSQNSPEIP